MGAIKFRFSSFAFLFMLAFLFVMPFVSSEAWNLDDAEYLGISTFVEGNDPRAISFNQNGSNMYILDANYDSRSDLYQYSCSIPWQVESCVYVTEINLNDSHQQWDLFFDENGTRLYVLEMGDIKQYSLSVPWDITTISFDGSSVDLPHDVRGIQFSPEGSRLYIVDNLIGKDRFYQYNCSESWNLSTCSQGASLSSRDEVTWKIEFSSDGTRFYELGTYASTFHQYSCSSPWELGTCSYDSITLSTRAGGFSSSDLSFSSDGTYMYELSKSTGELFQYIMEYSDIHVLGPRDFEQSAPNTPGLYVRVSDEEGDSLDVRFYDAFDDSLIGERLNVSSDSKVLMYWENLTWGGTYEWYVETFDGVNTTTSDVYTFSVLDSFDSCMTFRVPGEYILQSDIVNAPANCFYVSTDNVMINGNGYSMKGMRDVDYTSGIRVYYANDVVIKNFANISDFFHGIHVIGGNNNTIFNVTSSFNPSNGITVQQSEGSSVLNSTIYSNRNGIVLAYGGGLHKASGNKVYSNDGYGIYIDTLETPSGIEFFEDYNVIRENEIHSNTKGGYYSKASNYNYVFLNEIYSNGWGIEIYDSSNGNIFHNNSVYWNPLGVEIYGCQNNEFAYNFFNNTVNTEFVIPASNSWNNTFGGNWWATVSGEGYSDTCIDFDFDGFCDYVYDVQYDARDCSSINCDYMPYAMKIGQPSGMNVLTDCQDITESGEYILLKNITNDGLGVDGNCFSIYADDVILDGNFYELIGDFDNSGFGIHVSSANNVVIKNFKNISGFNDAIIFNSAENGMITDVNISNNQNYGIYFSSSVNNTVTKTLVEGISNYGVYVAFGSSNLFFNNIFNNSNNVNHYLSSNFWNNSKIGNFWFNPVSESVSELCDDLNIDGICDSSYDVVLNTAECSSGNCDYLPKSTKTFILTDCATIAASGNYALGNDITNGTGGVVGTCIRVDADNVILNGNGYKIVGDGIGTTAEIGVYIDRSVNTTVKNFKEISGFGRGIYSYFESRNTIINNTLINNTQGINIGSSHYTNVTNNSIFGSAAEYGIYATNTANFSITNNFVSDSSDYGVQLQSPQGLFFDGNVILNSAIGINVYMTSRNNMFSNNNISFNSLNGLVISTYYENTTVERNIFSYNWNGISSSDLRDVIVRENSFILNNQYAMDINGFIPGHVYNNSFNGMNHIDYGSSTNYRSMNNSLVGNLWTKPSEIGYSEYCFDLNSDGFCDNPYNYKTSMEDRFCYPGTCDYLVLSTEVGRDSYILPSYPRYNQDIVSLNPTLTVRPIRNSFTTFTVRFYDASDDSLIGEFFNVPNNETVEFVWDNLNMGEEYSWYSVAEDGSGELRSPTWNFKTYTEQLTECTTIKYPGTYVLQNDIQAEETCFVIESENVVIDGNGYSLSGSGAYYGIVLSDYVENLRNITIKNFNEINNFSNGIRAIDSASPRTNFADIKILNNSLINNQYAIYIQGYSNMISRNNLISENIFKFNSYSFYLYYFSDSVIEKNWFSDNGNFIRHTSTSKIFFQNEFYSNIFNQTPGNFTFALFQPMNWSNSEGGNYWANSNGTGFSQTCVDSDGNGFCDSPYNVEYMKYINFTTSELESSSENVDYLPLSTLPGWFTGIRYIEPEEKLNSNAGGGSVLVFSPTQDNLIDGYKRTLSKGKQVLIVFNDEEYIFEVLEVNDNDTIISFGNEKITLTSVSDIKLDLDGDGRYDLKITSTEILRAKVDLEFVLIDEEVPKEEVVLESSEDGAKVDGESKFASILQKVWIRWVVGGLGAILLAWFVLKKFYRK